MDDKNIKDDTRKLTYVVVFMSMFVITIYGLVPLI